MSFRLPVVLALLISGLASCHSNPKSPDIAPVTPAFQSSTTAVASYPDSNFPPSVSGAPYPTPENNPRATKAIPTLIGSGFATLSPDQIATDTQYMIEMAEITLANDQQTVTVTLNSRFFVFLDDEKYPVQELDCKPEWLMGAISNGSFRGPERYPIYFEPTRTGACRLSDRNFAVNLIIVEPTASSLTRTRLPIFASNTPEPLSTNYPTPAPVSDAILSNAVKNIEILANNLPFISETEYAIKEYYGCLNSPNSGLTIYYTIPFKKTENVRSHFNTWFENKSMTYQPWAELVISGLVGGEAWQTSAITAASASSNSRYALHVKFMAYQLNNTLAPSTENSSQSTDFSRVEIHAWIYYLATNVEIQTGWHREVLSTCKNEGWWFHRTQ